VEAVTAVCSKLTPVNSSTFTLSCICFQLSTEQTAQLGAELFIVRVSLLALDLGHYIVFAFHIEVNLFYVYECFDPMYVCNM
jgi:hypothetical protein